MAFCNSLTVQNGFVGAIVPQKQKFEERIPLELVLQWYLTIWGKSIFSAFQSPLKRGPKGQSKMKIQSRDTQPAVIFTYKMIFWPNMDRKNVNFGKKRP